MKRPPAVDEEPLDFTLWRAQLHAAPVVPSVHEQIGWAALLQTVGLPDPATQSLLKTAALRRGFSPQLLGTGLSEQPRLQPAAFTVAAPARLTIDIAIAELTGFAQALAGHLPSAMPDGGGSDVPVGSPHAALPQSARPAAVSADFGELIDDLHAFMQAPALPADLSDAERMLERLGAAMLRQPEIDYRRFAGAPIPALAYAIALVSLRELVQSNMDLMEGPLGSAAMLYHAARFDSAGLGPYFCNVRHLVRRSRDVFELAHIAQTASQEAGAPVDLDVWMALLSRALDGPLALEVIDDLGDLGMTGTLASLCCSIARLPIDRTDRKTAIRIRDAAIDNAHWELAARAQELLVRIDPSMLHEIGILATIHATAGNVTAAEQLFRECLALAPDFEDAALRLFALRTGRFGRFALRGGYETPIDRKLARMHRGDVSPARPGMTGGRILAVEA